MGGLTKTRGLLLIRALISSTGVDLREDWICRNLGVRKSMLGFVLDLVLRVRGEGTERFLSEGAGVEGSRVELTEAGVAGVGGEIEKIFGTVGNDIVGGARSKGIMDTCAVMISSLNSCARCLFHSAIPK